MSRKKPLNLILAIAVIASMLIGVIPAGAQTDPGPDATGNSSVIRAVRARPIHGWQRPRSRRRRSPRTSRRCRTTSGPTRTGR